MNKHQKIFLGLITVSGTLVLGSYILGVNDSGTADIMWGGVPTNWRGLYTISMIISALSYFIFSTYTFINIVGKKVQSKYPLYTIYILYSLILIPSALWIPLVESMIKSPSDLTWIAIRTVLILVAFGTLGLLFFFLRLPTQKKKFFYYISVVGIIIFLFHTGVLDAAIWPALW
jgi:hypothetical protein